MDAVGSGVRGKGDRSRAFIPGEAVGSGSVQVVRGGYVDWVADGTHAGTAWKGSGGETALGIHGPH